MKLVSQLKILFIIVCISCISEIAHSKPWPPEVDIYLIRFDYEGGYSNDALDIRKNKNTDIPLNEWLPSSNRNNPFAYIKSQSSRKIQFIVYVEDEDYRSIGLHTTTSGTGIGNVNVSFSVGWWIGQYWLKTTTLSGSVPSSVGCRNFTWYWYLDEIGEIELEESLLIATSGSHKHYTLLAAPQSPMSEPWTEVLDYSTGWAEGETSSSSAATEITEELYDIGFTYDVSAGAPRYGEINPYKFDLTQFLSELGDNEKVNCLDMGMAVTVFSNSIGCGFGLTRYGRIGGSGYAIDGPLNCIDPIGSASPTNNVFSTPLIDDDYRTGGFGYHAFAQKTSNYHVWDAGLRYDIDADPDNVTGSNPGPGTTTTGHTWKLPTNEAESTYISRLVDPWPVWYQNQPTWDRNRGFSVY